MNTTHFRQIVDLFMPMFDATSSGVGRASYTTCCAPRQCFGRWAPPSSKRAGAQVHYFQRTLCLFQLRRYPDSSA